MNGLVRQWIGAGLLALALAGCSGSEFEDRGLHHKAYQVYLKQVEASPGSRSAVRGMARTAPLAAAYWQRQAYAAEGADNLLESARSHKRVLEIKPNEIGSIAALRNIAKNHPDVYAQVLPRSPEVSLAQADAEVNESATRPSVQDSAEAEQPQPEPPPPAPEAKPEPKPKPIEYGPINRPIRANPYEFKPTVRRTDRDGEFLFSLRVSCEDNRYPKEARLKDGLSVELKDTDPDPLDADMNVYLRGRRIGKFKNLAEGDAMVVMGASSRIYEIIVLHIHDMTETVTVALRQSE